MTLQEKLAQFQKFNYRKTVMVYKVMVASNKKKYRADYITDNPLLAVEMFNNLTLGTSDKKKLVVSISPHDDGNISVSQTIKIVGN